MWGQEGTGRSDGYGLAKIAKYHPEVLEDLQHILDETHVVSASSNRIVLESDFHRVVVSKKLGDVETDKWLLTAYEKRETVSGGSSDIKPEPKEGKQNGTAPLQNGEPLNDKDKERAPKDSANGAVSEAADKITQDKGDKAAPRRRRKFTPFECTPSSAEAKKHHPSLAGVYHDDGYVVASDGYILVATTDGYEPELDGKIVDKKGAIIERKYPDWRKVIPDTEGCEPITVDFADMEQRMSEWAARESKKRKGDRTWDGMTKVVMPLIVNGKTVYVGLSAQQAAIFARAAQSIGAKDIVLEQGKEDNLFASGPIIAKSDKGAALLMPIIIDRDIVDLSKDPEKNGFYRYTLKGMEGKPQGTRLDIGEALSEEVATAESTHRVAERMGETIGLLRVEAVRSVDELTDEDFAKPTRNVQLPELPENVARAIGTDGKPVVIKKSIFEKNRDAHKELTAEKSREILSRALYNPDLVGSTQKRTRPDYRVAIQTGDRNAVTVLDVYAGKDNTEIVGCGR